MRVTDALRRPQTYLLIAVFFLIVTGNQALIFFLPSITDNMKSLPIDDAHRWPPACRTHAAHWAFC